MGNSENMDLIWTGGWEREALISAVSMDVQGSDDERHTAVVLISLDGCCSWEELAGYIGSEKETDLLVYIIAAL